ncbi:FAD-dependent oxidoreductase [Acuticoccus mangrovi]|uniref:FAD-dependent oxidoreductase n=1 Tax=Acuticoccus mangrovi TaxID=2796142 RepID=A0A934IKU7_9HYPH|nr:FAD-dependent oxidoreductase [Acuticoccus mangrovi]MBJ3774158.1 FAD-dependent oxidoreductase [Acuticoccus mangrovi]
MPRYTYRPFDYVAPPELTGGPVRDAPVVIVGAGPIGLAAAIDLALHGVASVVVDESDVVSVGSRAICWAKRTLEIFDRLGVGERMVEKGVTWKVGRLFHGEREVYSFDLLPEDGHKMPAFINLQQYYVEEYLVDRARDFPELIDLRWKSRLVGLAQTEAGVTATIETPDGRYDLAGRYLIAADGSRSTIRHLMGLEFEGTTFEDRFLIADVEMTADFPSERWFWFEPPFHPGQTALLHKQPDDIYRIDLQLDASADPEVEKRPENVIPRIEKAVGGRPFTLDWVSLYTFRCVRLARFVHGRVIFAGDSAHVVSPFGARGGNGGIQDVDNLAWKLAAVVKGEADAALLETYDRERVHATDENITNSSRSTNFMSPRTPMERLFRDQLLALAEDHPFARPMINSGRLSRPASLRGHVAAAPDGGGGPVHPGDPCPDAPLDGGFLLERLGGRFSLLAIGTAAPATLLPVLTLGSESLAAERYGRGLFLVRPDQHIAASWAPGEAGTAEIDAAVEAASARTKELA